MIIKYSIKYFMYKLGLRDTIPARVINDIEINENNEPLIDLRKDNSFFFDDKLKYKKEIFVRKTVYEKLKEAHKYLPKKYNFKIFSAYRSLEEQKLIWEKKYNEFKSKNPDLSEEELTKKTKVFCADPRSGFGGHQTGGAIDIGLCDDYGNIYEMGTKHSEISSKTKTKSSKLTIQENKNRHILLNALSKTGFKNYPAEWWHHSYGDRMWAAYSGKKKCIYGLASAKDSK